MLLDREKHFGGARRILRIYFETQFIGESIFRCEVSSKVDGRSISVIKGLMCHPPRFVTVDVPIRQDQLNLRQPGSESEIELKVLRNKIGIKSITASVEEQREPYAGSLEKLSLNIFKTGFTVSPSASWACPIFG